ncbi:MAG: hypothetical protein JRD89_09025 [Deltaproteobacteria bacterium]|nr:hypothetical protein [Deltaproteobacteria bacterium]
MMADLHLRFGDDEFRKLDLLREYLKELGVVRAGTRGEVVRYALNYLWDEVVKQIQQKRMGGA